ncbi:MAG: glycosyltransferase family 4 protein [Myxococcota bacterium]|nr:glycosyltransferase family 4 protein [Myxococcota bacterium]
MKTLATIANPGTFATSGVLVGRKVANAGFLRALLRFGSFEELCLFTGEQREVAPLMELLEGLPGAKDKRLSIRNLLELPQALQQGDLSVIHHHAHVGAMLDTIWLRDRHACRPTPITGQIHSISYPSMLTEYARAVLIGPGTGDAVFCSSSAGQDALRRCLESVAEPLGRPVPSWQLPIVPLGCDIERLGAGDGPSWRKSQGLPQDAFIVLCMARFSEHDKMDLFPLVRSFARVRQAVRDSSDEDRPLHLVLAGARQGTETPRMLELWAQFCGVGEHVHLVVDFPEDDKPNLLAAADVFVSPCDNPQETFGISVVEAMAAGLPLLVSDFDGYRDTATDDVAIRIPTRWIGDLSALSELGPILYQRPLHLFLGQSIEVDQDALVKGMLDLYHNEELRRNLGRAAAVKAATEYGWRHVIRRYEGVWSDLLEQPWTAPEVRPRNHPFIMDFTRHFQAYPTEVVRSIDRRPVCATPFGQEITRPRNRYPIVGEMRNLLTDEEITTYVDQTRTSILVSELFDQLSASFPDRARWQQPHQLAWLIKHGLLCWSSKTPGNG